MRSLGVFSVLLLGVSSIACAQNYVAAGHYNNPDVVVNMDVLSNQGMGSPSYPAPVLQQPLRPPVLQRPMAPRYATPPIALRPPQMSPPMMAPPPPMPSMPPQAPPMNITERAPPPMPMQPPVSSSSPPLSAPSPVADLPPSLATPPVAMAPPVSPPTNEPQANEPPEPEAFSTRELAASAEPLPPVMPPPASQAEEKPASVKAPEMKKSSQRVQSTAFAETPVRGENADRAQAKADTDTSYQEKPVTDAGVEKTAVTTLMPASAAATKSPPEQNTGRQLLAQAREEAGDTKGQERKVVLFDKPLSAPSKESPLKSSDTAPQKLEPVPVPVPTEPLAEPKIASASKTLKPAAMPAPIAQDEKLAEPLPIMPIDKESDTQAPVSADQKVAMLKPTALPDVAPASIPDSSAVKKSETVVDDFEAYRLLFDKTSAELKSTEREVLDNVIGKLKRDENIKLQLRAYANGTPDSSSQARRLSLSRALAVRTYLTQQGIAASRLDVRALGMGSPAMGDVATRADIPADRVDMIFTR